MVTIEELLSVAKQRRASDLHVTVGIPPKARINGELIDLDYPKLTPSEAMAMIGPLMNDKQKRVFEEKGEVDFSYAIASLGRFRVNVFKQRGSYATVIRLVDTVIPDARALGLTDSIVSLVNKKRGLVLVTGPTGSGKSTTLASLIQIINSTQNAHVITLEDPIEYLHMHRKAVVNQREIGIDTNSYADALRAALREDPDVIMVGEMRDLDTISTAVTAAETGHLVFSTLHTIGAASTIDRVIDIFPPYQQQQIRIQLAAVLEAVISQQLIPTADGKGRVAAFEIMRTTPAVRTMIREGKTHQVASVMQTGRHMGMQTMDDAIFDLYIKKRITADAALNFAQDPATLNKRMY